jgi:hypothetical protein
LKRSEQADKILKLLNEGKIFEAKMEIICLEGLLKLDENCDAFLKKTDELFKKVMEQHHTRTTHSRQKEVN